MISSVFWCIHLMILNLIESVILSEGSETSHHFESTNKIIRRPICQFYSFVFLWDNLKCPTSLMNYIMSKLAEIRNSLKLKNLLANTIIDVSVVKTNKWPNFQTHRCTVPSWNSRKVFESIFCCKCWVRRLCFIAF